MNGLHVARVPFVTQERGNPICHRLRVTFQIRCLDADESKQARSGSSDYHAWAGTPAGNPQVGRK